MQAVASQPRAFRTSSLAQTQINAQLPAVRAKLDTYGPARRSAAPLQAPPSFMVDGRKVVFGDILKVDSSVVFDVAAHRSTVKAVIELELPEKGEPVIELVPRATKVVLDGKEIDPASYSDVPDPAKESHFRIVGAELTPGRHRVEVEYVLTEGTRYSGDSVELFTSKSDLDDRSMDEQFFPTNLEYDQYPGSVTFEIRGTEAKHSVMTNGEVSEVDGKFVVTFPPYFNTASRYLNVINPTRFAITEGTYQGINGPIPITVYAPNNNLVDGENPALLGLKERLRPGPRNAAQQALTPAATVERGLEIAKAALAKHEKDIGPYPHSRLLIRVSGSGGMEYSGAIESDLSSIPHELHHQWFARSAQPANGNAGWIDEAVASWHDNGYPTSKQPPYSPQKLSGFPPWHRITPEAAYTHGAKIMAYLDSVFATKGGLRPVLAKFFEANKNGLFTTETFLAFVKEHGQGLNFDFDAFFKAQVYDTNLLRWA